MLSFADYSMYMCVLFIYIICICILYIFTERIVSLNLANVKPYNRTSCAQVHELRQSHCGDDRKSSLFSWLHIYYVHLASVRFEHSVCRGSLMTTCVYIYMYCIYYIYYIYISYIWYIYIYIYICIYIWTCSSLGPCMCCLSLFVCGISNQSPSRKTHYVSYLSKVDDLLQ